MSWNRIPGRGASRVLSEKQAAFLLTLARRIVPETRELGPEEEKAFFEIVERALVARPRSVRRQLGLFLFVLRWLPVFRYGARLERLPTVKQDSVLRWLQDNRRSLVRNGFWGIKTLIFMGYYGRPEVGERVGYYPSKTGNELLHAR